jgi:hypothetical protein
MKQALSFYAEQPTLSEMQIALGDIMTLQGGDTTTRVE